MCQLKLYGMKAAYDEIVSTAVKRQHEPQKIVGDLLTAETREKQARSIKYQMAIARLPLAKESTSSASKRRRSTRRWYAIWPAAPSSSSSATWC
jgi:hypothetical protein